MSSTTTPATSRSPFQPSERDRAIYEAVHWHSRPWADVGREFGLSPASVRSIYHRTQKAFAGKWLELSRHDDIDEVALQLERLEAQWREAMWEWHRSKENLHQVQSVDRNGDLTKKITVKQQFGAVRFLDQARKILTDMRVVRAYFNQLLAAAKADGRLAEKEAAAGPPAAMPQVVTTEADPVAEPAVAPAAVPQEDAAAGVAEPVGELAAPEDSERLPSLRPRSFFADLETIAPGDRQAAERLLEEYLHLPPDEFDRAFGLEGDDPAEGMALPADALALAAVGT